MGLAGHLIVVGLVVFAASVVYQVMRGRSG